MHKARRVLGAPDLIRHVDGGYEFVKDRRCAVDVSDFVRLARQGLAAIESGILPNGLHQLLVAEDLWRGNPFPEDADRPWTLSRREELVRIRREATRVAARVALSIRDPRAARLAGLAAGIDPLSEAANLLLVRTLTQSGDRSRALLTLRSFRTRLAEELGLDPSLEAEAVQMSLLRGEPLPDPPQPSGSTLLRIPDSTHELAVTRSTP